MSLIVDIYINLILHRYNLSNIVFPFTFSLWSQYEQSTNN
jgi:hypothetical protein